MGVAAIGTLLLAKSVFAAGIGEPFEKSLVLDLQSPAVVIADDAVITDAEIRSFLSTIPKKNRAQFLSSPERMAKSLQRMADIEQLALEAIGDGLLEDETVSAELYSLVTRKLAKTHVDNVVASRKLNDYSQQARELYLSSPEEFQEKQTFTFTHLLIGTSDRSESEAMRKVVQVLEQLESGESFDDLVKAYSEDPSLDETGGQYEAVTLDSLEKNFANTLRRMDVSESVSEPVRTRYGWHLIRLEEVTEPGRQDWDAAKEKALKMAEKQHAEKIRDNYTSEVLETSRAETEPDLVERYREEFGRSSD